MKIVIITQARMNSTRLPDKVMLNAGGMTFLEIHLSRLRQVNSPVSICVATTDSNSDDVIANLCRTNGYNVFRGSENDVLDRYYKAATEMHAEVVIRVTSDCPFIDPVVIDEMIADFLREPVDYLSNISPPTFPDGIDIEIVKYSALKSAWSDARDEISREHVTHYIRKHSNSEGGSLFKARNYIYPKDYSSLRMTLDTPDDLRVLRHVIEQYGIELSWLEYADIIKQEGETNNVLRNEKYVEQINKELSKMDSINKYKSSEEYLIKSESLIPLGSQTFSKSFLQLPVGQTPLFMKKAKGSKIYDVDDNEYIDFSNSLLAISLGYCDADVNKAVEDQLKKGSIFSLASPLEYEVAEIIARLVPSAKKVRFGKNGSDATSAAIRLSRAHTGKDHILACGYHGWQDWYIGATTRDLGVPAAVKELTHLFIYNDINSFKSLCKSYEGKIAAVIMEPVNLYPPKEGFLEEIREITAKNGIVLIFDETITGFRFSLGGAQEYFGIIPDLTTLGKGMSNGFPLSVVSGRADIMDLMTEIFFSTTFGGDAIALAAAKATLEKIERENVIKKFHETGTKLIEGVKEIAIKHKCNDFFDILGYAPWSFPTFKEVDGFSANELKTLFVQDMISNGIYLTASHNISYSHSEEDLQNLFKAYDFFFDRVGWGRSRGQLKTLLKSKVINPIFKVR